MVQEQDRSDAGREDDLVIQRIARRDPDACEAFIRRHHARVAALAGRLLGWSHDVDDVVQESFVAAVLNAGRFRHECSIETWLTRIVVNKCRTYRRRSMLGLDRLLQWGRRARQHSAADPADASALGSEANTRVREAVCKLPARDREVIVLRYLEQMEIEALAHVLGLSRGAVEVRLHRARERLRSLLPGFAESNRHGT